MENECKKLKSGKEKPNAGPPRQSTEKPGMGINERLFTKLYFSACA